MATVAGKVPFAELAGLVEKISERKGTDNKKKLLKQFITQWREFHTTLHGNKTVSDSFYPAMRLLLPQLEKEREAYGIKENKLARLYIKILGLNKESTAAQKLLNYKSPKNAKADAGDFASVAYYVLKPRCPDKSSLTVEEVNKYLDAVAQNNAAKNHDVVEKSLMQMLRKLTALEQKWLIRMIMKEMKMGLSQQSIFSIFHQDAEDLFNVKMSLAKVCTMLHDPSVRIHEIEVSLFSPFRPMLGDRAAPNKVEKLFEGKPFFIETKYDGERMQLHKKGDEYRFFSRGGNDYTSSFGSNPFDGNLVPYIHNCFKEDVISCILDGEMVGYNPTTRVISSKGENLDIKAQDTKEYQPCLCVFDILLLNDKVHSNSPLRERKKLLSEVFTPEEGRIMLSQTKEAKTKEECIEALNDAIDSREEGIMVKEPESVYKPNVRKGGWYKIKPEYVDGLMDQLDVLVIGGYFGKGHRAGVMSHFLCGVAVPPEDEEHPTVFHSFCRVGSGYTRKELYEFNGKLQEHWQPFNKKKFPMDKIVLAPGLKQKPDAWIDPSKSCILEIKAAEIIESDQFKTGYTLRFPRVETIRDDKPWHQCMTVRELDELRQKSEGKLSGRLMNMDEDEEPVKKKRKIITRHVKPTVAAQFRGVDSTTVTKVSEMLAGKEICVLSTPAAHSKASLEKKVLGYGGSIVQNPGDETFCVLAEKITVKVKNVISKGQHDVVKVSWFLSCIDQQQFIPWVPGDMIHKKPDTADKFAEQYDRYGDSFYESTDAQQLRKVLDKVDYEEAVDTDFIAETEMEHMPDDSPYGIFRICRLYLDSNLILGDTNTHIKGGSLELVALESRLHGATLTEKLDHRVTHVVMDHRDLSRLSLLQDVNRQRTKKFHIVTDSWVIESIQDSFLKKERLFYPKLSC